MIEFLPLRQICRGDGCRMGGVPRTRAAIRQKALQGIKPNPYYPSLEGVRVRERGRRQ